MGRKVLVILFLILLFKASGFCFCFEKAGALYGVNPALLWAIGWVESNLNHSAANYNSNGTKDVGVMQINSSWKDKVCWKLVEKHPCYNVMVAAWILRMCADKYGYDWNAVCCYHTGKPLSALKGEARKRALRYIRKVHEALVKASALQASFEASSRESRAAQSSNPQARAFF